MKEVILIPSYEPDDKLIELIKTINRTRFDIVVVDDGSGNKYQNYFNRIKESVHLISYETNMGKGYALKEGIKYIKDKYQKDYIIISMDSDGQHKINDAIKLSEYVKNHKNTLVLGKRLRNEKTPLRSKIGNGITKVVYSLITGVNIYDTQTGLRAWTDNLTDYLLEIEGNRFEYEMNCLLMAPKSGVKLHEIQIETIYYKNNHKTHFKTLRDSFLIYKDILKFMFSSFISFIIDFCLFSLFTFVFNNLIFCNVLARIISACCNYIINKNYVFKSKNKKSLLLYICLAIGVLIFNTFLLHIFVDKILMNKFVAKILVEIILFIISFIVQQRIVFKNNSYKK